MRALLAMILFLAASGTTGWFVSSIWLHVENPLETAKPPDAPRSESLLGSTQNVGSTTPIRPFASAAPEYEQLFAAALAGFSDSRNDSFPEQMNALDQIKDSDLRKEATRSVLRRWFESDPRKAFEWIARQGQQRSRRGYAVFEIGFGLWASMDAEAAMETANNLPDHHRFKKRTKRILVKQIAQEDPMKALMLANGSYYSEIFVSLARQNVSKALEAAKTLKTRDARNDCLRAIISEWSKTDPKAAVEYTKREHPEREKMIFESLKVIAESDWRYALDVAKNNLIKDRREYAISHAFKQAAKADPVEALEMANALDDPGDRHAALASLSVSLAQSGESELSIRALLESQNAGETAKLVFKGLADQNWNAAANCAMELDDSSVRVQALNGLLSSLQYEADSYDDLDERTVALVEAISETGESPGKLSMPDGLEPDTIRYLMANHRDVMEDSLEDVLSGLANENPEEVARLLGELGGFSGKSKTTRKLVANWSTLDPSEVVEWAASTLDGYDKNEAFKNIASTWSRLDPLAAKEWITGLESSSARDAAVEQYINVMINQNPSALVELAQSLETDAQRNRILQRILEKWARRDPEQALQIADTLELPDKTTASLQRTAETTRARNQARDDVPLR